MHYSDNLYKMTTIEDFYNYLDEYYYNNNIIHIRRAHKIDSDKLLVFYDNQGIYEYCRNMRKAIDVFNTYNFIETYNICVSFSKYKYFIYNICNEK